MALASNLQCGTAASENFQQLKSEMTRELKIPKGTTDLFSGLDRCMGIALSIAGVETV
jgi:hypothetical protein